MAELWVWEIKSGEFAVDFSGGDVVCFRGLDLAEQGLRCSEVEGSCTLMNHSTLR